MAPSPQPLYCWDNALDSSQNQNLSSQYDDPFVDALSDHGIDSDFIPHFMQGCDENETCNYTTKGVVEFCQGTDIRGLRENERAKTELVALLDDGVGTSALGLHQALVKPKNEVRKTAKREGADASSRQPTKRSKEQYIPNLTPWTVVALAASTPNYQVGVVGEFIFNHLRFDPLINANIQRDHFPFFTFEFHLPCVLLREQRLPQKDGRRLRKHHEITFLYNMGKKVDNSPTKYLYESNTSCLISGPSRYSWTGFLIKDRYFTIDDDPESIEEYIAQGQDGVMPDPFAAGKRPMGDLPCDAREHWLIAIGNSLKQVNKESWHVFTVIDEAIQTYGKNWNKMICRVSYKNGYQRVSSDTDKSRSRLREEHQDWMRRSLEVLRKIMGILNQYSEEWKMFSDHGLNYFMSTDDANHLNRLRRSLVDVDQQIIRLERLRNKYKHELVCCEDMARDFNDRIALEDNESAFFQKKTARDVKVLTWMTFLSLPFGLAFSLLSTQDGYIPMKPSLGALIASIAVFEGVIWMILGSLLGWGCFREKVKDWLPHQLRSKKMEIEEELDIQQIEGLT
ncbi:uncharacterized protein GGS22DRAFT_186782 [Annulohypoxylon maeteangense]|uniref:uncharacterized protein n=1 Tax=Annulohypoxylon maeteangense TaxID=1927788 RepID=UPI002007645A|nr:uncharacterized protein GGS22DRAFT_186782 [Annulohypoxylon maeteangense]KAI0886709.1 hypothetical protein GGS22DRAFT_186782 [Annulohypoxylon maeteangense]